MTRSSVTTACAAISVPIKCGCFRCAVQALTALTGLRLADTHLSIDAPSASSIDTLTALQHLALEDCPSLDPALLRPMTNLHHLQISHTDLTGGAAGTADFLTWLSRLQGLTHLDLSRSMWRPNAGAANPAAYSAFTASSSLQILDLTAAWLPAGAWAGIFPPSRQLPQPRSVCLVNTPNSLSSSDLASLVACCPGVRSLDLARSGSYGDELSVFQQLTSLTKLSVACSNSQVATTVLPRLTGLRDLRLGLLSRVKADRLSPLTTMTQLTMLTVGSLPRDDQHIFYSLVSALCRQKAGLSCYVSSFQCGRRCSEVGITSSSCLTVTLFPSDAFRRTVLEVPSVLRATVQLLVTPAQTQKFTRLGASTHLGRLASLLSVTTLH